MFHIVIWIPASDFKNQDKRKSIEVEIQRCIADRLGICISGIKDEENIANKIRAELDGAKYLLLLDDVKVNINLEKIGIPPNTQGSKIVYTTNFGVYPFGIPPDHESFTLTMKRLSDGDSWQIFEDIVSKENVLLLQRDIKAIARQVVDCCDGLMSIIIIVADNFKLRDCLESWSNGLEMLKRPPMKEDIPMEALKKFLNFSYGSLTENEQIYFLFCVLYPEDHKIPIDCLFDCWAANNLLQKGVPGKQILGRLLKMALLNECSNKQYVTVDNVYRKAAMKILREHGHLKCLVAPEANTKLQKDDCKDIHWISLANSGIDGLPTEVDCPNLTTLFLQNNSKLKAISSSFFRNIGKLLVLDLYKTGLESVLPMSHMQMLKVLYVNSCAMLEVVDIRGCVFSEIPHDIKKLKHLRRLLVSIDCGRTLGDLNTTELSSLKELIIYVKSDVVHVNVKARKTWCYKVIKDILEKIDPSEELTTLKFHFENSIVDIIEVLCDRLKIFVPKQGSLKHIWKERRNKHFTAQVYIGLEMTSSLQIPEFFPNTSFVLSCDKIVSDTVIDEVMGKVKALSVMRANSMDNLDQNATSSSDVIHDCLIHKCDNIETFMKIDGFSNLKTLVLSECSQLKALFSNNVAQQVGIKHLEIRDCPTIEEINMLSTSCGDILPTLTTLIVHNLHKLEKICSDMKWPSMSTLEIYKCPMLMTLPLNGNNANNLRNIKVEEM
ncbi:putative P-loop containing nucleoside triphosphate hydrolase, leucine-rich repeat domain superfamily [Helianthus annuus]|nr:putative P-loop containing nucleoside triphosphate hydrolase, leucine-rich repeat domain superfamily [Helianthus annuus]KAJ0474047.1 putative P-loop containing nucleoside triphosphate hydrolase, leucine-rich repeat domain superfamily [Helianthus annuus]KAJ0649611.1 putative P-loop containing nucleoside triphosphate hydrolase, leucine-rich repeat domain superfamily [Helianthus annuus]